MKKTFENNIMYNYMFRALFYANASVLIRFTEPLNNFKMTIVCNLHFGIYIVFNVNWTHKHYVGISINILIYVTMCCNMPRWKILQVLLKEWKQIWKISTGVINLTLLVS